MTRRMTKSDDKNHKPPFRYVLDGGVFCYWKLIRETLGLSPAEISHMYRQVLHSGYARSRELYKGTPIITNRVPLTHCVYQQAHINR